MISSTRVIHKKKMTIGYSAIDYRGNLKIVSIMNFLQDTASEHASLLGVSGIDLARENLAWVIHRYHIDIHHHPFWQQPISIRTFRYPHQKLYEMRNLTICIQKNISTSGYALHSPAIRARVRWVMINRDTGKPVRLSRFMDEDMCTPLSQNRFEDLCQSIGDRCLPIDLPILEHEQFPDQTPAFIQPAPTHHRKYDLSLHNHGINSQDNDPCRHKVNLMARSSHCIEDNYDIKQNHVIEQNHGNDYAIDYQYDFPDIVPPLKTNFQLTFNVRMHDLDLNGHVNNAIFVEWAVETVPEDILSKYSPMTIDVIFQKEALYGDAIVSKTELWLQPDSSHPLTRHVIIRDRGQEELACLNIQWRTTTLSRDQVQG
ncbi:MAG: hypothetical protein HQK66_00100 [Desulfamplus sp.]|nr:hypothetical protein [Desulfamplus sp.]